MQLSFGQPTVGGFTPPSAPLSFGSLAQYGQSPYSLGTTPAPAPGPTVPAPAPVVPAPSAYTSGYDGPSVDAVMNGAKTADPLTNTMAGILGGKGGWLQKSFMQDGALNFDNIGQLMKGVGALGNLWNGFKANRLASDALDFQKEAYQTNLNNQTASYNMALEDRIRARYVQEGRGSAAADAYIAKHKLGA